MADEIHEAQLSLTDLNTRYDSKNDTTHNRNNSSTGDDDGTSGEVKLAPTPSAGSASQYFRHGMYSLLMASMSSLALGGARARIAPDRSQSQPAQMQSWFGGGGRDVSDSGTSSILTGNTGSLSQHPLSIRKLGRMGSVGRGAASDSGSGQVVRTTAGPGLVRCASTDRKTMIGLTRLGVVGVGAGGEREGQGSLSWGPLPMSSARGSGGGASSAVESKLRLCSVVEHHPEEGSDFSAASASSTNATSSHGCNSGGGNAASTLPVSCSAGEGSGGGGGGVQLLGSGGDSELFGWPGTGADAAVMQAGALQHANTGQGGTSQDGRGGVSEAPFLPSESWQEQFLAQPQPVGPQPAALSSQQQSISVTQLHNLLHPPAPPEALLQQDQHFSALSRPPGSGPIPPTDRLHAHAQPQDTAVQLQAHLEPSEQDQDPHIVTHDRHGHDMPSQAMSAQPVTEHSPPATHPLGQPVCKTQSDEHIRPNNQSHVSSSQPQPADAAIGMQDTHSPVHSVTRQSGGSSQHDESTSAGNSPRRIGTAPPPLSHHPSTQDRDPRTSIFSAEVAPHLSDRPSDLTVSSSSQGYETQPGTGSAPSTGRQTDTGLSTVLGRVGSGMLLAREQPPLLLQSPRAPPGVDNSDGRQLQGLDCDSSEPPMADDVVPFAASRQ